MFIVDVQQYNEPMTVTITHKDDDRLWVSIAGGRDDLTINSSFLDTTENFELRKEMVDYAWDIYTAITDIRDGEKLEAISSESRYESDGDDEFQIYTHYENGYKKYEFRGNEVLELTRSGELRDGEALWVETLISYKIR